MTKWLPCLDAEIKSKYLALAAAIEDAVQRGDLAPGDQLPTHRDLADILGVTVGTVTRGYNEARKRGIISGTVGRGTYVSAGVRADASLEPGNLYGDSIDMGFVTPLYQFDPDMRQTLLELAGQEDIQQTLCYDDPVGPWRDRHAGVQWLKKYGVRVSENEVVICAGAQHGLCCVLNGILPRGALVAVETMTYPGLKTLAVMLGIPLVPIAMDQEGMIPESLETACKRDHVKAIFLMPALQNPTTARMSRKRRAALAALADKYDIMIIEDCAYGLGSVEAVDPLAMMVPERTILIAGVSKYFGAGLRTAYMVAGRKYRLQLRQALFNTVWMSSPVTARIATNLIETGAAQRALNAKIAEIVARNSIAAEVLRQERFSSQSDGFFLWLDLPACWTGPRFELAAADRHVTVFCGDKFAVGGGEPPNGVRISLTGPRNRDELRYGLETVRDLLHESPQLSALL